MTFARRAPIELTLLAFAAVSLPSCGGRTSLRNYLGDAGGTGSVAGSGGTGGAFSGGGGSFGTGGSLVGTGGSAGGGTGGALTCAGGAPPNGEPVIPCPSNDFCVPGERLVILERASECQPCPPATFSTEYSAPTCEPWSQCTWEQREVVPPSPSQDRVCDGSYPALQFGTPEPDEAMDIAIDEQGYIFVSGQTYGSLDAPAMGDGDAFVRKYSASGELIWSQQYGGFDSEAASHLALGNDGQVHALVNRWTLETQDTSVLSFDADGALIRDLYFDDYGTALEVASDGNLLLAQFVTTESGVMYAVLHKLGSDGSVLWANTVEAGGHVYASDFEALDDGEFALVGSTGGPLFRPNSGLQEAFVARFSASGAVLWGIQFGTAAWAHAVAVVASGSQLYVAGVWAKSSQETSDGFVVHVDEVGVHWVQTIDSDETDEIVDMATGPGGLVVAGRTYGKLGVSSYGSEDAFVHRARTNGNDRTLQFGTDQADWAKALAVAPDGRVFVVGATAGSLEKKVGGFDAYVYRAPEDF